jgi:ferrous iron transport protein A
VTDSTTLEAMRGGGRGVVVRVRGGRGVVRKLEAMGLRPGKEVRKLGTQFMAGPVTVLIDGRQVAMGRGIARKIELRELE